MGKDEKDKKSFILYSDLLDRIEMLTIEERGILFTHLLEYVNGKEPILTDRLLLAVWKPIELELKRNFKKYEEAKESKAIGGRLGNLKRWNPDLYERVVDKKLSLEEAERIAISRKVSHTDKEVSHTDKEVSHTDKEVSLHVASVAVDVDVDDNVDVDVDVDDNVDVDVDVDDNVILLEKETKSNICEISDFEVLEYEEIKTENSPLKTEKNIEVEIYPTFDDFWDLYDKKVGDRDKIKLKWNKLDQETKLKIMDYIPKYKLSQPDKKYRKNPQTFLNNKSWNDEIIMSNNYENGKQQFNSNPEFGFITQTLRDKGLR